LPPVPASGAVTAKFHFGVFFWFSLIFEGLPTYQNIVNGTVKMVWIFTFSLSNAQNSDLVRLHGFSWNAIEYTIKKWMEVINDLDFRIEDQIFKRGIG
jgi:hypothetical protein